MPSFRFYICMYNFEVLEFYYYCFIVLHHQTAEANFVSFSSLYLYDNFLFGD